MTEQPTEDTQRETADGWAVVECVRCGTQWSGGGELPTECPECRAGTTSGPWTRHGHPVPGITVAGPGRPPVARCGGPAICRECSVDAERIRAEARTATTTEERTDG